MENLKLDEFKKEIKNKKIAVIGIGISNIPAITYLVKLGAHVCARDKKEILGDECDILKELNIDFVLGDKYLDNLDEYDYIFRSPGVKPFSKEIEKAIALGVILTSEIELVISLSPCKVIGITGSDGKTTTTTLVSKFLEEAGYKVWLGGNIGYPIFSKIEQMNKEDIIVLELSSFQLMTLKQSPYICVITNISPNHLDYHRSFEEYIDAKANIFLNQKQDGILVLNQDSEYTKRYENEILQRQIKTNIRKFSVIDDIQNGVFLQNGNIISNIDNKTQNISKISNVKLVGIHNLANICAAASAIIHLTGINPIKRVINSFIGVEHRMELVRQIDGVKWYNDSIATSPTRTIAGLVSFKQQIILIAGGYDKNIPYDSIGAYILDKVKLLLLIGKTAPKIQKAVIDEAKKRNIDQTVKIVNLKTLEECVEYANSNSLNGDIVVLSPASASFDMYKNFEQRGDHFKRLVEEIAN
ncbi:MAG: UDP-N-acetylmuramoyl-L-alanine--D-glutamate ligase [Clostridia bacterium]